MGFTIRLQATCKKILYHIFTLFFTLCNKIFPKKKCVFISTARDLEGNAVAVANYIVKHYNLTVYYTVSSSFLKNHSDKSLLHTHVKLIEKRTLTTRLKYITSKYIFYTHGTSLLSLSKRQTVINLGHGLLYKQLGKMLGSKGHPANITVGTSKISKEMFSKAFGVPKNKITTSGYPRNDILLHSKENKHKLIKEIDGSLVDFKKLIIWLPTFRRNSKNKFKKRNNGKEVGNPFYIKNFNIVYFNRILKENNTLCILKPHPSAPRYNNPDPFTNLKFIDDEWLAIHNITLYHLLGCVDILISDVSSVIIDFLLMDKPIVCMSEDFEEYKSTRGFYFDDIKNWIPTKVITEQKEFFTYLKCLLTGNIDPYKKKRLSLKHKFFNHQQENSIERIIKHVFN